MIFKDVFNLIEKICKSVNYIRKTIEFLKKISIYFGYIIFATYVFIICVKVKIVRNFIIKYSEIEIVDKLVNYIYQHTNQLLFLLLLYLIVVFFYKIWKFGKLNIDEHNKLEYFADQLHKKFIHDIRDAYKELEIEKKELRRSKGTATNEIKKRMIMSLCTNVGQYIDLLENHLSNYCQTTISVCVKIIKLENNDVNNPMAETLARSSNTKVKRRKSNESVSVKTHTDFQYLYNKLGNFYGKADLKKEYMANNYSVEEEPKIWNEKYNSTIVVPIQYHSQRSNHNNVEMDFDLLGFLCIDSKEIMHNWENDNSYELKILAIFADELYIYLKHFKDIYCSK